MDGSGGSIGRTPTRAALRSASRRRSLPVVPLDDATTTTTAATTTTTTTTTTVPRR